MWESGTRERSQFERGQVGIGTLIVFIAMVLVAAIGAGVLLNTAGELSSTAEQVGYESSQQVTDRVVVASALGRVTPEKNDARTKRGGDLVENETVDEIAVTVMLAPGAESVNLSRATVEWRGPNRATTLVHGSTDDHVPTAGGTDSGAFSVSGLEPEPSDDDGDDSHRTFNTYDINGDDHAVLNDRSQRVRIYLNASQIESGSDGGTAPPDAQPLEPGSDVELVITTAAGATTTYRLDVPESLSGEEFVSV
ncbi:archaellin/type IV pilin N-terminal domain-containing protein [Halorussus amylolyticus]|uniref:archaellin/type IV pilin N-terminal domain-containing protein n=1 Tax=Halorussus amylolyticus TaxID=1126242 RepID=UPI00104D5C87|nr:archaellin/type IV pilin N-terminal domain-containing protein [Halorussus amylolyticus]